MSTPDRDWPAHAARLADGIAGTVSRWREPVATTPRHLLVPRWFVRGSAGSWEVADTETDGIHAAYRNQTLVTRIGDLHADHAAPETQVTGRPTSSSTQPSLVVRMLRQAQVVPGCDVLDVGVGSGYSAALLAHRLGDKQITGVDVDPYLVQAASERLSAFGLKPTLHAVDATGALPGMYDRIVAMVSVRPVPASWLKALRTSGRLVTAIAGTSIVLTAHKTADGGASGQVEQAPAGFMPTRSGEDYPSTRQDDPFEAIRDAAGEHVSRGRYPIPLVRIDNTWDLYSMIALAIPGVEHHHTTDGDRRTAYMSHPDGSWARAGAHGREAPLVHQSGPRHLWDILERIFDDWHETASFPLAGARVRIDPDGTCHLARGTWHASIT